MVYRVRPLYGAHCMVGGSTDTVCIVEGHVWSPTVRGRAFVQSTLYGWGVLYGAGPLFGVHCQGCHSTGKLGKQGIWKCIFPDRENTGNLPKNIKNMFYTGNLTLT